MVKKMEANFGIPPFIVIKYFSYLQLRRWLHFKRIKIMFLRNWLIL
jgi:hypothetical protein